MKSYGQYCPISRTAELLGDRWTIHIVRDLLTGTNRFNELIRGNPGLSRALLTRRLRQLRSAEVVEQHDDGSYQLTESGRDLEPVVFGLATWGARWTFGEPTADELDPDLLLWWLHRQLDTTDLPALGSPSTCRSPTTRVATGSSSKSEASICLVDPGFDVDVTLRTDRAALYRTYLGRTSLADAQRRGEVEMTGSQQAVRAFFNAFRQSPVADDRRERVAVTRASRWVTPPPRCRTSRAVGLAWPGRTTAAGGRLVAMCRSIRTLHNFAPPATDAEVHAAALQYVRKISGAAGPSQANREAFDRAVAEIARATETLLAGLSTSAPPRDREVEAAKARARAEIRYARP